MSKPLSIVIDADIARSSGTSEHPVSSGSRRLLENVQRNGHKAAMCPILLAEWRKHRSVFASRWLASMFAKRQISLIEPNSSIKGSIAHNITDKKQVEIAEKDVHLIDAAIETDKIIASNDDNARNVFCLLSSNCGELRSIKWFNAVNDRVIIQDYLGKNSFVPRDYYLRS